MPKESKTKGMNTDKYIILHVLFCFVFNITKIELHNILLPFETAKKLLGHPVF